LMAESPLVLCSCFMSDTATSEIYTLSLHDALPILVGVGVGAERQRPALVALGPQLLLQQRRRIALGEQPRLEVEAGRQAEPGMRSEEHTSELQSRENLVCRLLLEKKKGQRK